MFAIAQPTNRSRWGTEAEREREMTNTYEGVTILCFRLSNFLDILIVAALCFLVDRVFWLLVHNAVTRRVADWKGELSVARIDHIVGTFFHDKRWSWTYAIFQVKKIPDSTDMHQVLTAKGMGDVTQMRTPEDREAISNTVPVSGYPISRLAVLPNS